MFNAVARSSTHPSQPISEERKPPASESHSWGGRQRTQAEVQVVSKPAPVPFPPPIPTSEPSSAAALSLPREGGSYANVLSLERHCSVGELSKLWGFSENTIRRLFRKEPGVIKIVREQTRQKRGYTTIRIPERVAQRVHRRLQGLS